MWRLAVICALLTKPVTLCFRSCTVVNFKNYPHIFAITSKKKVSVASLSPKNSFNGSFKVSTPLFTSIFSTFKETLSVDNMPPKGKRAAPPKEETASKKPKVSKKKAGGDENGTDKPPGRQSKRNVDKVVVYKEVAENVDEKASESQPRKGLATKAAKRKAKKAKRKAGSDSEESDESSEGENSDEDFRPSVKAKSPEKKETKKAKADGDRTNKTETDFAAIDFRSDKTTKDGNPWNLKISSWNVGGLKAWLKKGALDFIKHEDPDVFCMQETRCSESKLPTECKVSGYHAYWLSGEKEGYAGVGLYSKEKPIEVKYGLNNKEHDAEGRIITAEFEKFFLVVAYVPNAGRGLVTLPKRLKWDPDLRSYLKDLDDKKPVILCGDLNVSHQAIDLANPKTNTKNAGYTQEERDGMTELLKEGFVDSFRHLNPDKTGAYTFWTYMNNARSRNTGWRLDYFIISEKLVSNLCDSVIRSEVFGSDHCPITLMLNV